MFYNCVHLVHIGSGSTMTDALSELYLLWEFWIVVGGIVILLLFVCIVWRCICKCKSRNKTKKHGNRRYSSMDQHQTNYVKPSDDTGYQAVQLAGYEPRATTDWDI